MTSYLFGSKKVAPKPDMKMTVAVAESVTAGALSNALCTEPGSSDFFAGGVITYNRKSNKEILDIVPRKEDKYNFANDYTTGEMAAAACRMFKSRIGIATTGYSLPINKKKNNDRSACPMEITIPYAIICLYDSLLDKYIFKKISFPYDAKYSKKINRALVQTKVAEAGRKLFQSYIEKNN